MVRAILDIRSRLPRIAQPDGPDPVRCDVVVHLAALIEDDRPSVTRPTQRVHATGRLQQGGEAAGGDRRDLEIEGPDSSSLIPGCETRAVRRPHRTPVTAAGYLVRHGT